MFVKGHFLSPSHEESLSLVSAIPGLVLATTGWAGEMCAFPGPQISAPSLSYHLLTLAQDPIKDAKALRC